MNKINFYHDAWRATRTAGRWDLAFHDLRRTAASLLLAHSGAELAELTFVLGQSQIAHAVDLYGHLVPGRYFKGVARDVRHGGQHRAAAGGGGGAVPGSGGCATSSAGDVTARSPCVAAA